jgi:hypothetical protein
VLAHNTHHFNHFCHRSPPQSPRKQVRFKPTMPTSRDLLLPSVLATSGNLHPTSITGAAAKGNNIDIDLDKYVNSQTFAPPGARPLCSRKPPTKTQAAADRKAEKEAKGKKDAEEKKLAAAARRADAKNKKQEKLITAAETKAQKAVAKANELRKKLDDAKKAIEEKLPALQSNKKIKGAAGKSTPTPTTATAFFVESPQRKAFSTKKRVNTHSPYRHHSPALPTGGSSKSSSSSASDSRGGVWIMGGRDLQVQQLQGQGGDARGASTLSWSAHLEMGRPQACVTKGQGAKADKGFYLHAGQV